MSETILDAIIEQLDDEVTPNRRTKSSAQLTFTFARPATVEVQPEAPRQRVLKRGKTESFGDYGRTTKRKFGAWAKRRKTKLEAVLGLELGRIIACGAMGCVMEAARWGSPRSERKVLKLTPAAAEASFWRHMSLEQQDPHSPASLGVVHVDEVFMLKLKREIDIGNWRFTNEVFGVLRDDVTPAFRPFFGAYNGWTGPHLIVTKETAREIDLVEGGEVNIDAGLRDLAVQAPEVCDDAILAAEEYELADVHLGNVGWKDGRLVIFDAISYVDEESLPTVQEYVMNPGMLLL